MSSSDEGDFFSIGRPLRGVVVVRVLGDVDGFGFTVGGDDVDVRVVVFVGGRESQVF